HPAGEEGYTGQRGVETRQQAVRPPLLKLGIERHGDQGTAIDAIRDALAPGREPAPSLRPPPPRNGGPELECSGVADVPWRKSDSYGFRREHVELRPTAGPAPQEIEASFGLRRRALELYARGALVRAREFSREVECAHELPARLERIRCRGHGRSVGLDGIVDRPGSGSPVFGHPVRAVLPGGVAAIEQFV